LSHAEFEHVTIIWTNRLLEEKPTSNRAKYISGELLEDFYALGSANLRMLAIQSHDLHNPSVIRGIVGKNALARPSCGIEGLLATLRLRMMVFIQGSRTP
jgi:hypothetical protein